MNKVQKSKVLVLMALVACLSIMCGIVLFMNPSSSKASALPNTFEMVDADVRLDSECDKLSGDTGLRFGFKVDEKTYTALEIGRAHV